MPCWQRWTSPSAACSNFSKIFAVADHHFRNADFPGADERLVQKRVRLFAAFLRLEEVGLVEEFRIDLCLFDEISDVDRVRRLDLHFREIFVLHDDEAAALVLETLHDFRRGHFFLINLGDLLIFDRAEVARAELPEAEFLLARGGVNGDRDVNEPEADAAFPNWSHKRMAGCGG